VGAQGVAERPKLRVEKKPFLASKAVIFSVNSAGPHIHIVTATIQTDREICPANMSTLFISYANHCPDIRKPQGKKEIVVSHVGRVHIK
jgi:hypothetical protein